MPKSASGSIGLALLDRQRAAGLVSGAFAEIVVLRCKKLGFGGSGDTRIVAVGIGQRRCGQFLGLALSSLAPRLEVLGRFGALGRPSLERLGAKRG